MPSQSFVCNPADLSPELSEERPHLGSH